MYPHSFDPDEEPFGGEDLPSLSEVELPGWFGVVRVSCYLDTCDCYVDALIEADTYSQGYRRVQQGIQFLGWMTDPINIGDDAVEVCGCHLEGKS